jgi:hypothetical protein
MGKSENATRINTWISRDAKQRLMCACAVRGDGLGHVNLGVMLTEVIMTHLPPAPGEKRPIKKTHDAEKLRMVAS